MPRITVEWLAIRTAEQRMQLARRITDAVVDVTSCRPDQVTVLFNEVNPDLQAKGGVFWTDILKNQQETKT